MGKSVLIKSKILIAAAATAFIMGQSFAADIEIEPSPAYQPRIVHKAYDWTGLYFGVNVGYGSVRYSSVIDFTGGALDGVSVTNAANFSGALAGVQAGFNWQAGWVVAGVEVDGMWTNQNRSATIVCGVACSFVDSTTMKSVVTARARVGAAFDRVLVYVTGGMAFVGTSDNLTMTFLGNTATFAPLSNSKLGWTAGLGVEAAIWGHWSVRAEYLYIDAKGPASGSVAPLLFAHDVTVTSRIQQSIARLGVNYRFGP